ncbi:MAG: hypothetical protein IPO36_18600 [Anaerolineales bacterium]|nr:hypothetical protein [Anaerolineales bacterium]
MSNSSPVGSRLAVSPDLYCPNDYVTRDQMAIFLLRAKYGSAHPAARNWRIFRRTHRLLGGRVDPNGARRRRHRLGAATTAILCPSQLVGAPRWQSSS